MKIGDKIRKIRNLKGFKQETIADRLGITVNGYGKLEREENNISIERLEQIAKALEVEIKDILSFDETNIFNIKSNQNLVNGVYNNNVISEKERELYEQQILLLKEMIRAKDEVINILKSK